ncbi:radical SAM/SPASM domain-containing protein [Clostridium hydrogenum]|uniref:radical SAM/SPASM domain-containing protein n=1 Tax=Clostridium hydrogenum TaxID=2855764 RepID=UPI001F2BDC81|nr:radical SAM protein [Clostridium hydrogenum]
MYNISDYVISFNESIGAIYNVPNFSLIKVAPKIAEQIKEEIKSNCISEDTLGFLKKNFKKNNEKSNYLFDFVDNKKISKLQFMVTNSCNLNCKYCYANGGTYNQPVGTMSTKTADDIIDKLALDIDEINSVQFFGGEPLQAYKVIMHICDRIRQKFKKVNEFTMVSNFTMLPIEFIDYIKKYNISITVSLDGPEEINDRLRIAKNKNFSTFKQVKNNIDLLRAYGGNINAIECTYTDEHKKLGYTKEWLRNFFKQQFNVEMIIIADEGKKDTLTKLDLKDIIDDFKNNKNISVEKIGVLIKLLKKSNISRYCNAGFNAITFFQNGDMYPCHMFVLNNDYYMGNVSDDNIFFSSKFKSVKNKLDNINKCDDCNARNICSKCPGNLSLNSSKANDISICETYRKFMEDIILEIVNFLEHSNLKDLLPLNKF